MEDTSKNPGAVAEPEVIGVPRPLEVAKPVTPDTLTQPVAPVSEAAVQATPAPVTAEPVLTQGEKVDIALNQSMQPGMSETAPADKPKEEGIIAKIFSLFKPAPKQQKPV